MNSVVSSSAIEPILQRMSSVDHDGNVSSNDESSRDQDEDDEEAATEKPDEVPSPLTVSVTVSGATTPSGVVGEVASPMVVQDEDDEDDEEEEVEDSQPTSDSSDTTSGSTAVAVSPSVAAVDSIIREHSPLFDCPRRRINFDEEDEDSSSSTTSTNSASEVVVIAPPSAVGESSMSSRAVATEPIQLASRGSGHVSRSPRRFMPYQTPSSHSASSQRAPSSSSGEIPSIDEILGLLGNNHNNGPRLGNIANVTSRLSGMVQIHRQIPGASSSLGATAAATAETSQGEAGPAPSQRPVSGFNSQLSQPPAQQQHVNVPQNHQVIRSAIVGNRTIITTKTPSKFPFSADLQQAGAAILGDRYILFDLCDGTSLYKCIDVKTKEEFVCKVSG